MGSPAPVCFATHEYSIWSPGFVPLEVDHDLNLNLLSKSVYSELADKCLIGNPMVSILRNHLILDGPIFRFLPVLYKDVISYLALYLRCLCTSLQPHCLDRGLCSQQTPLALMEDFDLIKRSVDARKMRVEHIATLQIMAILQSHFLTVILCC